jgi:xanthine/uracil/vitamin C permease (AzgA family)
MAVVAPTTSTSLYFAVFLQNRGMSQNSGNFAILLLGLLFLFLSLRRVAVFTSNLVPFVLKAGICLGVGMLIALDALTEIGMVQTGTYTILSMGPFTSKIWISILAFVAIALLMSARVKGAFVIGIMLGSILYWMGHPETWPEQIFVETSDIKFYFPFSFDSNQIYDVLRLVVDLLFIGTLNVEIDVIVNNIW